MMLVLAILLAVALGRVGEPSYGGRSLGSWLRVLHNPKSTPAQQQLAQDAIRAMGTNVLPSLVSAMEGSGTGFLVPFVGLGQRLGLRYQLPMHLAWSKAGLLQLSIGYLDELTRYEAVRVLFQSCVEERLHGNPNDQRRQQNLANAMFSCGDCFLEFLAGALANPQPETRIQAASLVGFRNTPTNFVGLLTERLSDPVPGVRWHALWSLSRFRKQHTKDPLGWVHRSYALHELKRTAEARDNLLRVVDKFPADVQKSVYWLAAARQAGHKPGDVLDRVVALVVYQENAAKLTKDALLRNLDIAEKLGCLNPAGLAEMRRGNAATVVKGPYKGDELSVDHIIPRAVVLELDNVIANLELMPLRMNQKKNATIGDRQRNMAKKFHHAGLLSRKGLEAVLR